LSFQLDDLNSVGESYTENHFRQLVVPIGGEVEALMMILCKGLDFGRNSTQFGIAFRRPVERLSVP
jgi:hypothetical protein